MNMKNFEVRNYKTKANAQKAAAQFRRHGTKVSDIFRHFRDDKRLKESNRFTFAIAVFK